MKKFSVLNTLEESEFYSLCKSIIQDYLISTQKDDSLRFTSPFYPIINVRQDNVDFLQYNGLSFNYNIMSHDSTPGDDWARIVHPLDLFQSYYFTYTPTSVSDCLYFLKKSILNSLEVILKFVTEKEKIQDFTEINYIFLSNIDFDFSKIDYAKWISDNLNNHFSNVNFQIATSISILNNLSNSKIVKEKYLNIINKNDSIIIIPVEKGIKAVNFCYAGLDIISDVDKDVPFNIFVKSNRRALELDKSIDEFNDLINNEKAIEDDFQSFFIKNPIFLTGLSYSAIRSKVILERKEGNPLIPDFFLEPIYNQYWDILDLKRPTTKLIINKKNRVRFSHHVHEAVAQLRTYGNYFNDSSNRDLIKSKYGIQCYNPKLIVVIGTKYSIDEMMFKNSELDLSKVHIKTYDELAEEVKFVRNWLSD